MDEDGDVPMRDASSLPSSSSPPSSILDTATGASSSNGVDASNDTSHPSSTLSAGAPGARKRKRLLDVDSDASSSDDDAADDEVTRLALSAAARDEPLAVKSEDGVVSTGINAMEVDEDSSDDSAGESRGEVVNARVKTKQQQQKRQRKKKKLNVRDFEELEAEADEDDEDEEDVEDQGDYEEDGWMVPDSNPQVARLSAGGGRRKRKAAAVANASFKEEFANEAKARSSAAALDDDDDDDDDDSDDGDFEAPGEGDDDDEESDGEDGDDGGDESGDSSDSSGVRRRRKKPRLAREDLELVGAVRDIDEDVSDSSSDEDSDDGRKKGRIRRLGTREQKAVAEDIRSVAASAVAQTTEVEGEGEGEDGEAARRRRDDVFVDDNAAEEDEMADFIEGQNYALDDDDDDPAAAAAIFGESDLFSTLDMFVSASAPSAAADEPVVKLDAAEREAEKIRRQMSANLEPAVAAQQFLTQEDEVIRTTDQPERLQARIGLRRKLDSDLAIRRALEAEATWIIKHAFAGEERWTPMVTTVLRMLRIEHLEVPYIALYKRDLIRTYRRSRGDAQTVPEESLDTPDLWLIYRWDRKWDMLVQQRQLLLDEIEERNGRIGALDINLEFHVERALHMSQLSDVHSFLRFERQFRAAEAMLQRAAAAAAAPAAPSPARDRSGKEEASEDDEPEQEPGAPATTNPTPTPTADADDPDYDPDKPDEIGEANDFRSLLGNVDDNDDDDEDGDVSMAVLDERDASNLQQLQRDFGMGRSNDLVRASSGSLKRPGQGGESRKVLGVSESGEPGAVPSASARVNTNAGVLRLSQLILPLAPRQVYEYLDQQGGSMMDPLPAHLDLRREARSAVSREQAQRFDSEYKDYILKLRTWVRRGRFAARTIAAAEAEDEDDEGDADMGASSSKASAPKVVRIATDVELEDAELEIQRYCDERLVELPEEEDEDEAELLRLLQDDASAGKTAATQHLKSSEKVAARQRPVAPTDPVDVVIRRARKLAVQRLATEPLLRDWFRTRFLNLAEVNTRPTRRGHAELDWMHPLYAAKRIVSKPVLRFLDQSQPRVGGKPAPTEAESLKRRMDYVLVNKARKNKYITSWIAIPGSAAAAARERARRNERLGLNPTPAEVEAAERDELARDTELANAAYILVGGMDSTPASVLHQRRLMAEELFTKHLYPMAEQYADQLLLERAQEALTEACGDRLWNIVTRGGLQLETRAARDKKLARLKNRGRRRRRDDSDDEYDHPMYASAHTASVGARIMTCITGDMTSPTYFAILNEFGELIDHIELHAIKTRARAGGKEAGMRQVYERKKADLDRLRRLVGTHEPQHLAIGATDMFCRNLRVELEKALYDHPTLRIGLVDPSVSHIYAASQRSALEFPELPPLLRQAISLGRFVLDPLSEVCGLYESDARNPGHVHIMSLQLNELQAELPKQMLLERISETLSEAVSLVGVDVNAIISRPFLQGTLQFVPGLGPRKAKHIIDCVKRSAGVMVTRRQLLRELGRRDKDELNIELPALPEHGREVDKDVADLHISMGPVVFRNCAGFLRVRLPLMYGASYTAHATALDTTAIHPEMYGEAIDIIQDTFDRRDGDDSKPSVTSKYPPKNVVLVKEAMKPENASQLEVLDLDTYAEIVAELRTKPLESLREKLADAKAVLERVKAARHDPVAAQDQPGAGSSLPTYSEALREVRQLEREVIALEEQARPLYNHYRLIRAELIHPYHSSRVIRPYEEPGTRELFYLLSGETPQTLSVRQQVAAKVTRLTPYGVQCRLTDSELRGFIRLRNIDADDEPPQGVDEAEVLQWLEGVVKPGEVLPCRVTSIKYDVCDVELTSRAEEVHDMKPSHEDLAELQHDLSYLRDDPESEAEWAATEQKRRAKKIKLLRRKIAHPLFRNFTRAEAEAWLLEKEGADRGQGNCVVRPDSRRWSRLTLTFCVSAIDNLFMHVPIQEFDKPTPDSLGQRLEMLGVEYEDLDELDARFVQPVARLCKSVEGQEKFHAGTERNIHERFQGGLRRAQGRIEWALCWSAKHAGHLRFNYQRSSAAIRYVYIKLTPKGFKWEGQYYRKAHHVINAIKRKLPEILKRQAAQQQQQPPPQMRPPAHPMMPPHMQQPPQPLPMPQPGYGVPMPPPQAPPQPVYPGGPGYGAAPPPPPQQPRRRDRSRSRSRDRYRRRSRSRERRYRSRSRSRERRRDERRPMPPPPMPAPGYMSSAPAPPPPQPAMPVGAAPPPGAPYGRPSQPVYQGAPAPAPAPNQGFMPAPPPPGPPAASSSAAGALRVGETVTALFSDGNWYPARIDRISGTGAIDVTYTGYGNTGTVSMSQIRRA